MRKANYFFRLDKFHIDNTRAVDEDTDVVAIAVKVDGRTIGPEIRHMGDVDNGDHIVNLEIGPILVENPNTELEFNFQIINSGNKNDGEIKNLVGKGADTLFAKAFASGNPWAVAGAGAIKLLSALFTVDCDGPVALDAFAMTGANLDALASENNVHSTTKFYPGIDSDIGCGSNSRYTVTWSVFRIPVLEGPLVGTLNGVPIEATFTIGNFARVDPRGRAL
jgi:hypothetical protein